MYDRQYDIAGINCGLIDYKLFCFDGKVRFLYAMGNRKLGSSVSAGIFDRNFVNTNTRIVGDELLKDMRKPGNFEELIRVAEKLASGFPHVRVDLYDIGSQIRFGELTFFGGNGYTRYSPDYFDVMAGQYFTLPAKYKRK